ncbi:hypothetical protein [Poseidonibacter lekithochrous]|uniref:hypothetical protein n=1 Tax=Poseidonibacter lekithochrous TaxID=1904463 RepID=UPI0008FC8CC9|nr:hypothetical protein [Poseidonibacter lekithochrous]QKJ24565.1 hypothetical protein ALEK_3361 [Poseidonibacter lekithochrous]|tara:strand:- start:234 stop:497 length:264 start_codon:yes stop_codon:yes gene_type:complete
MNFTESLLNHIDKLVGTLKPEDELQEVLKKKFTKKEYKIFVAFEEGKSLEEVKEIVRNDEERIEEVYKAACKKINQEKIKKELVFFN